MAERKMLIVVGAGASTECGLPTGKQLKATIAYLLDMEFGYGITKGDEVIWEAIKIAAQRANDRDLNAYAHAARQIRNAMPQAISIDNYLDAHEGDMEFPGFRGASSNDA